MNHSLIGIDEPEGNEREAPIVRSQWSFDTMLKDPAGYAHFERTPMWMYGLTKASATAIHQLAKQGNVSGAEDAIREVLIKSDHALMLAQNRGHLPEIIKEVLTNRQVQEQLLLVTGQLDEKQNEPGGWFKTNLAIKRMEEYGMVIPLLRKLLERRPKGPVLNLTTWKSSGITTVLGDTVQRVALESVESTPFGSKNATTVMHHPALKPNGDEGMDIALLEKALRSTQPGGIVIVITPDRVDEPGSRESLRRNFRVKDTTPTMEQYLRQVEKAHYGAKIVRSELILHANTAQSRAVLAELARLMIPTNFRPTDTNPVESWLQQNMPSGYLTHKMSALVIERGQTFTSIPRFPSSGSKAAPTASSTAPLALKRYTPETLRADSPAEVIQQIEAIAERSHYGTDDQMLRKLVEESGLSMEMYRVLSSSRAELQALITNGTATIAPVLDAYAGSRRAAEERRERAKKPTRSPSPARPRSDFEEFASPTALKLAIADGVIDPADIEEDHAPSRELIREERAQPTTHAAATTPRSIPIASAPPIPTSHVRSSTPLPAHTMNTPSDTPQNNEPAELLTIEVQMQRLEERADAIGTFEGSHDKTDDDRKSALAIVNDAIGIGLKPDFLLAKMRISPQSLTIWKRNPTIVTGIEMQELKDEIDSVNDHIRRFIQNDTEKKLAAVALYRLYQMKVDITHAGYQVRMGHKIAEDMLATWNTECEGKTLNRLMREAGMNVEAEETNQINDAAETISTVTSATTSQAEAILGSLAAATTTNNSEGNGQVTDARVTTTPSAPTDAHPTSTDSDDGESQAGANEVLPADIAALIKTIHPIGKGRVKIPMETHTQIAAVYHRSLDIGYGYDALFARLEVPPHKFRAMRQDPKLPYCQLSETEKTVLEQCERILQSISRTGTQAYSEREARAAVICSRYYRRQGDGFNKRVMEIGRMSSAKISIWNNEYMGQTSQSLLPDLYPTVDTPLTDASDDEASADESLTTAHDATNRQVTDDAVAAPTTDGVTLVDERVEPAVKPVDVSAAINEQSSRVRREAAAVIDPALVERMQQLETTVQQQGEVIEQMRQTIAELQQVLSNRQPPVASVNGSTTIDAGHNDIQVERTPFSIAITINNQK